MPAIAQKNSRKNKQRSETTDPTEEVRDSQRVQRDLDLKALALLAVHGAILGLSAPGFEQWYLAWFGLVPLLFGVVSSASLIQAFVRATVFGTAYNAVYLSWYTGLQPLDWLGFNGWQGWGMALFALAFESVHQGLIVGLFGLVAQLVPMRGSLFFKKQEGSWQLPALVMIPILWELLVNKLGNAHYLTGVPWSMLEYSQYRQLPLIQVTSIIGGIGLGALIVSFNTAIAAWAAAVLKDRQLEPIAAANRSAGLLQVLAVGTLVLAIAAGGAFKLASTKETASLPVSVLQGNINIDMQKTKHRYTLDELSAHYLEMAELCRSGLVIWTESALPTYLDQAGNTKSKLSAIAARRHLDMVVGAIDRDGLERPYNSAYGITGSGAFTTEKYHKRYLVPFGEYTPMFFRNMPEWIRRLTNTPAGGGFESGTRAEILPLDCGKLAPLICFETLSPELVSESVRAGGEILVNVSDLAWFHKSIIGQQMIAFSVMRAIENDRYFVFAANTGPSAIISPSGKVISQSGQDQTRIVTGKIKPQSSLTFFTRWYLF